MDRCKAAKEGSSTKEAATMLLLNLRPWRETAAMSASILLLTDHDLADMLVSQLAAEALRDETCTINSTKVLFASVLRVCQDVSDVLLVDEVRLAKHKIAVASASVCTVFTSAGNR